MSTNIYDGLSDLKKGQDRIMELLDAMKNESNQRIIYDLVDLRDKLNVSRRLLATWTKEGILPHSKVGNKIFVTDEQLQTFLDQHSKNDKGNLKIREGRNHDTTK